MNLPISNDELKIFQQRSDAKALQIVAGTWFSIIAIFVVAALIPHWTIYVAAVLLLAGRQHALAAIMHETGHNTLFASRKYNEFVSTWLSAPFLLLDGKSYSKGHLQHHRNAGTENDPDLANYINYPVTKASIIRKFLRDLSGITGLKANAYMLLSGNDMLTRQKRNSGQLTRGIFVNVLMFTMLWICGYPQLYTLWVIAYFTAYMAVIRMRQITEHAGVKDHYHSEPKYNTRSIPRGILGLLFFSPTDGLSYHCEHHACMAVPTYHLKALHKLFRERGYYDDVELADNYLAVFRQVLN